MNDETRHRLLGPCRRLLGPCPGLKSGGRSSDSTTHYNELSALWPARRGESAAPAVERRFSQNRKNWRSG
ncbi:unnamed protein product, partial [Nesidiocoris tenuis]